MIISCVFLSSFIMLPPIKFCKYRKRGNPIWQNCHGLLNEKLIDVVRELSHLGEASQYRWSSVLQLWIELLNTNRNIFSLIIKSSFVKPETRCTGILPGW